MHETWDITEQWKWFGHAGHFICSHDCLFHMTTQIGDYLISSVGEYRPRHKWVGDRAPEAEDIGCGRKFETYVFRVLEGRCDCGCELPNFDSGEIDSLTANDAKTAQRNHMELCHKYAKTHMSKPRISKR